MARLCCVESDVKFRVTPGISVCGMTLGIDPERFTQWLQSTYIWLVYVEGLVGWHVGHALDKTLGEGITLKPHYDFYGDGIDIRVSAQLGFPVSYKCKKLDRFVHQVIVGVMLRRAMDIYRRDVLHGGDELTETEHRWGDDLKNYIPTAALSSHSHMIRFQRNKRKGD